MSVAKRIIDLAKANLNALLEKAAETVDPRRKLSSIPDAELEAELARRRSARVSDEKVADAKARIDGARAPKDREERERIAREREARVRAARDARAQAQAQAQSQQQARARSHQQHQQQTRTQSGPRPSGGGSGGGATARGKDPLLSRYYDRLEVPYGSAFETVKSSYRRLMKKYHPDLHANKGPEKLRAAHEVSQALTQAYNELEKHLLGGPNRK